MSKCRSLVRPASGSRTGDSCRDEHPPKYAPSSSTTNRSRAATLPCCCAPIPTLKSSANAARVRRPSARSASASPDLLFLDVQMPECDGFDVLEMLGKDLPPAIVFVTAYDQYALRAFEAGALDYLLKPFDNARFDLRPHRAKQKIVLKPETRHASSERLAIKSAGAGRLREHLRD